MASTSTGPNTLQRRGELFAAAAELDVGVQFIRSLNLRALDVPGVDDPAGVLRRAGVQEGQPFVLGPNGSYDPSLNRFFRELNGWGVRSENGIAAYTRDVMLFRRFLHESRGGKSIWECDGNDLRAYKHARLYAEGPHQVSVQTWNRSIAALDKWVQWSIYEGMLAAEPFRYIDRTVMTPQGLRRVRVNAEHEIDSERQPIRFVSFEDYLLWRDVGLRGELPSGQPDPRWRGRYGDRNAAFADLLVFSGMRLGEASSLLLPEIPSLQDKIGAVSLSAAVTKRNKARTVYLPRRVIRALHHYIDIERDELIERLRGREANQDDGEQELLVRRIGRHGLSLDGEKGTWPYAKIGIESRRRLRRMDDSGAPAEPLWLWLGSRSRPLAASTWQSTFVRANKRCARFDIPIEIHPHTLRHVFAVHMLGLLLRQTVRALGRRQDEPIARAHLERLLVGNPMRKLQLLLGHAQESTVYLYLDVLDEAQEIVMAALAEWDTQVGVLGQVKADLPGGVS